MKQFENEPQDQCDKCDDCGELFQVYDCEDDTKYCWRCLNDIPLNIPLTKEGFPMSPPPNW